MRYFSLCSIPRTATPIPRTRQQQQQQQQQRCQRKVMEERERAEALHSTASKTRYGACLFDLCFKLGLPNTTAALACNHLFRFLAAAEDLVVSGEQVDLAMMTAAFLAAKASECPARMRDVINVFWKMRKESQEVPSLDAAFWVMKQAIVDCEQVLLRHLGFSVDTTLPYAFLLNYCRSLRVSEGVARCAFAIANDMCASPKQLQHEPHVCACACIFIANSLVEGEPEIDPRCWSVFDVDDAALARCVEDFLPG